MITVPKEKYTLFNFILEMLQETGKIHDQELRSTQYLGFHENILIILALT